MKFATPCRFGNRRYSPDYIGRNLRYEYSRPKKILPCVLVFCAAVFLAGCMDPGSRALLKGERLLQEGKYAKAVTTLEDAARLLPRNAQAWNHLGLAYHHQGKFPEARKAYMQALNLDYNLAAARFNLGCLSLENNDTPVAVDQLTSYTLLQPRSLEGWLKLGTAQLRAKRLDPAEKAFKTALEISPNNCEALNGLGNVQFYRRRNQEALAAFNHSLELNPQYAPALLNAAIVTHQSLNNRGLALQMYRRYAAQQPRAANADAVLAVANQLDQELNPPPPVQTAPNLPAQAALARTNAPMLHTNPSARVAAMAQTSSVPGSAQRLAAGPPNILTKPQPAPVTNKSEMPNTKAKESPIEVTRLPDDLTIRPAQDISTAASKSNMQTQPAVRSSSAEDSNAAWKTDRRTLIARLNPFNAKSKTATNNNPAVPQGDLPQTIEPRPAEPSSAPLPAFPRYAYLSPPKPSSGDRKEAEKSFTTAVKAQRGGNLKEALAGYAKAIAADPAYFEAHYNRGLAAYELGSWTESLRAYEYALALRPDSVDARYNFALALKSANYVDDAIQQLTQIIKTHPTEARAHLSLANLYAYRLNQPTLARQHFAKVLENDPRHPQAAEIRFWLAAHPM